MNYTVGLYFEPGFLIPPIDNSDFMSSYGKNDNFNVPIIGVKDQTGKIIFTLDYKPEKTKSKTIYLARVGSNQLHYRLGCKELYFTDNIHKELLRVVVPYHNTPSYQFANPPIYRLYKNQNLVSKIELIETVDPIYKIAIENLPNITLNLGWFWSKGFILYDASSVKIVEVKEAERDRRDWHIQFYNNNDKSILIGTLSVLHYMTAQII